MTKEEKFNTVYIVGGYPEYEHMFKNNDWRVVDCLEDADIVQFCGGADVSPSLYKESAHITTRVNANRDKYEATIFKWCFENDVPMVGICRGAQFLHVMSGGSLWQNVNRHAVSEGHTAFVLNDDNRLDTPSPHVQVSSTHHQMMRTGAKPCEVLLSAGSRSTVKESMRDGHNAHDIDLEAVYHDDTDCLCFQPHPEFYGVEHECQRLYFKLIYNYLFCEEATE